MAAENITPFEHMRLDPQQAVGMLPIKVVMACISPTSDALRAILRRYQGFPGVTYLQTFFSQMTVDQRQTMVKALGKIARHLQEEGVTDPTITHIRAINETTLIHTVAPMVRNSYSPSVASLQVFRR